MPQIQTSGVWVTLTSPTVTIATLPANFDILRTVLEVTVAFDAGGNNNISIGWTGSTQAIATNTSVATTGRKIMTAGSSQKLNTTSQVIRAYYTQSGGAATVGKAYVAIEYILTPPSP